MTGPTKSLSSEESWQLNDDDLFAPLPDIIRLGGPGPFVINLSASPMPIALPSKGLFGELQFHIYQVQRVEDGRPRYRLRLGPLATEEAADAVLPNVRSHYPGALIARADAEDLRAVAKLPALVGAAPKPTAATKPAQTPIATPKLAVATTPSQAPRTVPKQTDISTPMQAVASTAPIARPAAATAVVEPEFVLSLVPDEPVAVAAEAAPPPAPTQPPRIAPNASQPAVMKNPTPPMAKSAAPTAKAATPAAAPRPKPPAAAMNRAAVPVAGRAPAMSPPIRLQGSSPPRQVASSPPTSVPTTRTVRALTTLELEDDKASRWFVIQLALAGEAFDPESVPNLDIFSAYRLYSVAGIDQGRIVHALRLGFFTDEAAARAVASYLGSFYEKPVIRRVSFAEHQRFAEESMAPRKDVGATGKQAVIEITNERFVRAARTVQAPK